MNPPAQFTYRLGLYDSAIVFDITPRDAGVYKERVSVGGNSILSTLWVKSVDAGASVSARWYDIGPGNDEYPGEQIDLVNHGTITTSDVSDRRVAAKCHNKAFLEVTVTGGSATFGVYVTVVSSFPSGGLYLEGQSAILTTDGGTGITLYDTSDGKFYLARGDHGVANVNIVGGSIYTGVPGDPFVFKSKIETTGIWQTLISETVPVGKKWRLVSVKFLARCYGEGDILIDEISIDNALTSPAESNVMCDKNPLIEMIAGQKLEVKYKRNFGSNNADINAIATLTTIDV